MLGDFKTHVRSTYYSFPTFFLNEKTGAEKSNEIRSK